ncbi:hypothetical protein NO976_02553 [Planktothrix agardhii]|jgi:hypothetical protein|uniref:hypothetical protein n=1 Tax=Planktothrix agardhii TaxID=1160 RepID=UPI001F4893CD|nr:hypothetical protein [Planktothrix agardhii]MCF3575186.1 hypothetical protein [Planktothrix agardhii 1812]MCF3581025.1 hypothetical protein [Planktothrix agardhii 1811]MCF3625627.1 hypothetical protein [Planktothrix agardhii 1801]MCP9295130.1 hypothetical protein [Planktothrix agardhii LY1]CAD5949971.1 hypothetical protein NO976_02553 [Planktothrix agardhii]
MPTDSVKNIERAFTGRVPVVQLNNDAPINQVFEIINYREILSKIKPVGATNVNLSIALETLQLISYLPGIFKPNKLPDYDEDLIPLLQKQAEDLAWMAEFNPSTQYALEITLFESWYSGSSWSAWSALARKWLYNQQTEYYLDLINPFLTNTKNSDIGDANYKLGIAITQKPTQQTAKANQNYIRIRTAYSGIITYEQPSTVVTAVTLNKQSNSLNPITLNTSIQILYNDYNRKILYLQNTGKSVVYFNFDQNLISPEASPFLLPGETFTFESGEFKWSGGGIQFLPPMAQYLFQTGLWIYCTGKDTDGKTTTKNSIAWMQFLG